VTKALPLFGQPNPNEVQDLRLVGRYALGVDWADRHGSIYPFDQLRRSCPCGSCAALGEMSQEMTWPREIKRLVETIRIVWSDDHESLYPCVALRGLCRCATCTGGH
jgi:DUF971 family protein